MTNWTIRKRITVGFATILALGVIQAGISATLLRKVSVETHFMDTDAVPGMSAITSIQSLLCDSQIRTLQAAFSKTAQERKADLDKVETLKGQLAKAVEDYEKTISLDEDRQLFAKLKEARSSYVTTRGQVCELLAAGKDEEAKGLIPTQLTPRYDAYFDAVEKLVHYNITNADLSSDRSEVAVQHAKSWMLGITVGNLVLGSFFATVIIVGLCRALGRLAGSLSEGASQVSAAASQVSNSSQSLAEGSSEQAASLEETSASLEEIASMTQRNAQNVQSAKEFTAQTRSTAEAGAQSTHEMGQAMSGIRSATSEMRDAMNGIKTASNDVSKIIKTIDEIAFQTNILALNAAVEAARAGEAGMGFAVVADEVRSLAQRSAKAAKETADMIETSIKRSEDGVRVTEKVVASVEEVAAKSQLLEQRLGEIVTKAQQVDAQVAQIASASQEQTQGINEVNMAVGQMDKVTQNSAANAEESAAAAEELNAQAEVLKQAVSELERLVHGRKQRAGSAAPAFQNASRATKEKPARASANSSRGNAPATTISMTGPAESARSMASAESRPEIPMPELSSGGSDASGGFKDF